MRRVLVLALALMMTLGCLAGCGDAGNAAESPAESSGSSSEVEASPITINFWTTSIPEQGKTDYIGEFKAQFEKDNPDIRLEISTIAWNDLRTTITPALKSGEGPDVFQYTPGPGYVGVMADAGMLMELDDYAAEAKWDTYVPDWYLDQLRYNGKLYGMSNGLTQLGVYYNKDTFAELGISVPKTYAEFLEVCESIKTSDKGVSPLVLDMKDQWPAFHYSTMFYTSFAGADKLLEAEETYQGWDSEPFAAANTAMVDLIDKGYCSGDPNGIASADANTEFFSGKAAMRMTGSWLAGEMYKNMGENVGFFPLPPADGVESGLCGGSGDEWCISSKTAYPEQSKRVVDAIVRYLPYWSASYVPATKEIEDKESLGMDPLTLEVYDYVSKATSFGIIVDTYMPQEFNETMKTEYQKLWAKKADGEEVAKALQESLATE